MTHYHITLLTDIIVSLSLTILGVVVLDKVIKYIDKK